VWTRNAGGSGAIDVRQRRGGALVVGADADVRIAELGEDRRHAHLLCGSVTGAVLLDLDETLVLEEPAAVAAFEATARTAPGVDAARLAVDARGWARTLWYAAPTHPYCKRIGISSWEGLWCRFEGEAQDVCALRAWAPEYRRVAWARALAEQDVDDPRLAEELGERFGAERRARHHTFEDVAAALDALAGRPMALVTNGAACLQREKLAASGLAGRFDAVVVSADLGVGKPDPSVFRHALALLGARDGVMVGDSLERDIDGALAAGLGAVWINRFGHGPGRDGVPEIASLAELPALV
jgi:putative hydrolase of the HAD superfamily